MAKTGNAQSVGAIDAQLKIFKALANPTRLKLVRKLAGCRDSESWGDLCAAHLLSQPTMSHHLIKLVETGVILEAKTGNQKSYVLDHGFLKKNGINISKI